MPKLLQFRQVLTIQCPACRNTQKMHCSTSNIWFPIRPFCCDVMYLADSTNWNQLLDIEIIKAKVQ